MEIDSRNVSRSYFWLIWGIYAMVYMTKNCFSAAMASIVVEGVMTKSQVGLITAVFYGVYAPLQIVGGICADKYNPEKLIITGLCGSSLANLILYFHQEYTVILIVWIFNAVIQFGIWPSVFKIISSRLAPSGRKSAVYYVSFSNTAGLILSYVAAAFLPAWYDNFALSAAVLALLALLLGVARRKVAPYLRPTAEVSSARERGAVNGVSTVKLLAVSGFVLLLAAVFLETVVGNSVKTLSATMLTESYHHVPPSMGNNLNVLIIAAGLISVVLMRRFIYPRRIKSAPVGILLTLSIGAVFSGLLLIRFTTAYLAVASLCVLSGVYSAMYLLASYCSLQFERFGKNGTVAGIMNATISAGMIVSNYGVTRIADRYGWGAVSLLYLALTAAAICLSAAMLPFWKRFQANGFSNTL